MKYVDASALLRLLFSEPGPSVPLLAGDRVVSSHLVEVEAFRAVDRERLLGNLDDRETALKRKELAELFLRMDLPHRRTNRPRGWGLGAFDSRSVPP